MYFALIVEDLIRTWLAEDVGHGDLTSELMIDAGALAAFDVNAREPLSLAGIEVMAAVFRQVGATVECRAQDGTKAAAGTVLARVSGRARAVLTAERTALNILQHLSGIATQTARFRGRDRGHAGADGGHAQDHAGVAHAGEACSDLRGRAEPSAGAR